MVRVKSYFGETGHFYFGVTNLISHKRFYVKFLIAQKKHIY